MTLGDVTTVAWRVVPGCSCAELVKRTSWISGNPCSGGLPAATAAFVSSVAFGLTTYDSAAAVPPSSAARRTISEYRSTVPTFVLPLDDPLAAGVRIPAGLGTAALCARAASRGVLRRACVGRRLACIPAAGSRHRRPDRLRAVC